MTHNLSAKKIFAHEYFIPAILFLLGAVLRLFYLGIVPGGYQMDEAYSAWNAFSLYHSGIDSAGYSFPVYFEAWGHGMNALNSYLMLPFIALNGGHVNLLIVRIPQVLVSLGSLIAIYALARKLISSAAANWALFLTAVFPWHIMMSRWGLESNLAPGFLIIGLCFFVYGFERPQFLLLSAASYGLSLYCYATIWPIVPFIILVQGIYALKYQKIRFSKWLVGAFVILISLAFPLVCFLLVNLGYLPNIQLGPFSIYKMTMFRGNELADSFSQVLSNAKNLLSLFYHQDIGRPYDVIMPYGFFYDIGRFFIVIGILFVLTDMVKAFIKKEFSYSFLLFIHLAGAGIIGLLIPVGMTQINCVYLPFILCETVGIIKLLSFLKKKSAKVFYGSGTVIALAYIVCLVGFQYSYYTDYKDLTSAYFQQGTDDAVRFALETAQEQNVDIYINDGLKYPNVLLSSETTAQEYLDTVIYSDNLPAPASFAKNGVTIHMGYSLEKISSDNIYIIYETDADTFSNFKLTPFGDWFVAVP